MNIKECVIFSKNFIPTDEFYEYIKLSGYYDPLRNMFSGISDFNFDKTVINYIKDNTNWDCFGKVQYAIRGRDSNENTIGFSGYAAIVNVDIDRNWTIDFVHNYRPLIKYIKVNKNKYNYIEIEEDKYDE